MNRDERLVFDDIDDGFGALDQRDDAVLRRDLRAAAGGARIVDDAPAVLATLRPRLVRARRRYVVIRAGAATTFAACVTAVALAVAGAANGGSHGQVRIVPPAGQETVDGSSPPATARDGLPHRAGPHTTTPGRATGPARGGRGGSGPTHIVVGHDDATAPSGTTPGATTPTSSTVPTTTPAVAPPPPGSTTTAPGTTTTTAPGMQTATYSEPHHGAGSVTVSWDAHHIVVDSVAAQSGWAYAVHYDDPDEVHVTFTRATPATFATMQFQLVGGTLVLDD